MQVWDTSSFITAWRVHYRPPTFEPLWDRIAAQMAIGRIIAPREVYNELEAKDDSVAEWAKDHPDLFIDPRVEVQRAAGRIQHDHFDAETVRDRADPWVIAEAEVNGFTVVTWEGVNIMTGETTTKFANKMPGVCARLSIDCCIVPEAIDRLGITLKSG